jgi:hypothetical protein
LKSLPSFLARTPFFTSIFIAYLCAGNCRNTHASNSKASRDSDDSCG